MPPDRIPAEYLDEPVDLRATAHAEKPGVILLAWSGDYGGSLELTVADARRLIYQLGCAQTTALRSDEPVLAYA